MNPRPFTTRANDAIAANDVLSSLRPSSKQQLVAGVTFQELEKDTVICHQEAAAVRFWLVLRGEVKMVKYTTNGAALLIELVLPNELFGTVFCGDKPVYPCSAVTMKHSELLAFRLKHLVADLENNSLLQKILLADTCSKLCHAQQMRGLWLEEARVRIAHLLLYLHETFGRVIPQTRATLAELAGTSVETAIRITNALSRHGILATSRGQMEILSLPGLRACAQSGGPAL